MLEDIRIFVKVVQFAGFSNAARVLKLPTSTVSRTITRLEQESGAKLLVRTTRSLKTTVAGQMFYESCLEHVQALEDARQSLLGTDSLAVGFVRITSPEDIGEHIISPVVGKLAKTHPGLTFELRYTNEILDLVNDGIDLAVRMGKLKSSQLSAKRVGTVTLVMVASPLYLHNRDAIRKPEDLAFHDCLTLADPPLNRQWNLRSGKTAVTIAIKVRAHSNQMTGLINIALQGAGIAFVPLYLCSDYIKSGKLIRILSEWAGESLPVSIVSTQSTGKIARHKIVAESLAAEISKRLS